MSCPAGWRVQPSSWSLLYSCQPLPFSWCTSWRYTATSNILCLLPFRFVRGRLWKRKKQQAVSMHKIWNPPVIILHYGASYATQQSPSHLSRFHWTSKPLCSRLQATITLQRTFENSKIQMSAHMWRIRNMTQESISVTSFLVWGLQTEMKHWNLPLEATKSRQIGYAQAKIVIRITSTQAFWFKRLGPPIPIPKQRKHPEPDEAQSCPRIFFCCLCEETSAWVPINRDR